MLVSRWVVRGYIYKKRAKRLSENHPSLRMQLVRAFPHDGKRHSTTTQHVRSWLMSATNTVCVTNIVYLTLRT